MAWQKRRSCFCYISTLAWIIHSYMPSCIGLNFWWGSSLCRSRIVPPPCISCLLESWTRSFKAVQARPKTWSSSSRCNKQMILFATITENFIFHIWTLYLASIHFRSKYFLVIIKESEFVDMIFSWYCHLSCTPFIVHVMYSVYPFRLIYFCPITFV